MRPIERRALEALRKKSMSAADLGWLLWGWTTSVPGRGTGSHLNNKFCRAAGKVLRDLERKGLVRVRVEGKRFVWRICGEGR